MELGSWLHVTLLNTDFWKLVQPKFCNYSLKLQMSLMTYIFHPCSSNYKELPIPQCKIMGICNYVVIIYFPKNYSCFWLTKKKHS
jgi:hypothetical protein